MWMLIMINSLIVFSQNPILSDYYLITFEFLLLDYIPLDKNVFTRCLSDSAVVKFKEVIPSAFNLVPCLNTAEDSYANLSPKLIILMIAPQAHCE